MPDEIQRRREWHRLSVEELEHEERLEEKRAEREDRRRFDEGFAEYERRIEDEVLRAGDQS